MNRGILHTALSGALQLELAYREPDSKEASVSQGEFSVVNSADGPRLRPETPEEFACLLRAV